MSTNGCAKKSSRSGAKRRVSRSGRFRPARAYSAGGIGNEAMRGTVGALQGGSVPDGDRDGDTSSFLKTGSRVTQDIFNDKSILITGGTGSFGKHYCKEILRRYKPARLVIYSRDELKQFEMQQD